MIFDKNNNFVIDEKCQLLWHSDENSISFEAFSEGNGNVQPIYWPDGDEKKRLPKMSREMFEQHFNQKIGNQKAASSIAAFLLDSSLKDTCHFFFELIAPLFVIFETAEAGATGRQQDDIAKFGFLFSNLNRPFHIVNLNNRNFFFFIF